MKKTLVKNIKKSNNNLLTKEYLNKYLNKRLIKTESRLDEKLKDTEERLSKRIDRLTKYIDFKLEPINEFKKEFQNFKNKVFERLDWLIGKYKKFDEEHIVLSEQNRVINDKLGKHEERISSLEQKVVTP